MHMIMAHAHAPALVTRAMLQKLHCELLISQWSALCFAQGKFCGSKAAISTRNETNGLDTTTAPATHTAHALVPAHAVILNVSGTCAITHVHLHAYTT